MMRQNELKEGVEVTDETGNVVGSSKIAARKVRLGLLSFYQTLTKCS